MLDAPLGPCSVGGVWKNSPPLTVTDLAYSVMAIHMDEYGRVVLRSEEAADNPQRSEFQKNICATVRQVTAREVFFAEKGTQRRPTLHFNRFVGHINTTRFREKV